MGTKICACGCGRHCVDPRSTFLRGHHCRIQGPEYIEADRGFTSPCWVWQKTIGENGYPVEQGEQAHRVYYRNAHGHLPAGADIDHLCRVPACVNPAHLEAVTHAENIRRSRVAKLTYAQVDEIRCLLAAGALTQKEIGARYGVHQTTVARINRADTWVAAGGAVA